MTVLAPTYALLAQVAHDPPPTDAQVKAGWGAFGIFILLILAVALLCYSFVRQLRKVNAAKQAGVYGEDEESASEPGAADGGADAEADSPAPR